MKWPQPQTLARLERLLGKYLRKFSLRHVLRSYLQAQKALPGLVVRAVQRRLDLK